MLAGADSIDDLLRHGGMDRLFGGCRAPSTLGTFLRSFTHGHVQQLDAVGSRVLAGLGGRVRGLLAGAESAEGIAFIDVDDTVREVHGYAIQAAAYGSFWLTITALLVVWVSSLRCRRVKTADVSKKPWHVVRAREPVTARTLAKPLDDRAGSSE